MLQYSDYRLLRPVVRDWQGQGKRVGLVPTMGYLHLGHLSLVRWARENCERVVVSIFVNPTQFGPDEDYDSYPVDRDRDLALLAKEGADLVYTPELRDMYAPDHSCWVVEDQVGQGLCGASRPGHFKGVTTVVCKLLQRIGPDLAVFGQKDWQQLAVIRRMVRDLDFQVQLIGRPTVRERDGLALSSRNKYLSAQEREQAPALYAGLQDLRRVVQGGQTDVQSLLHRAKQYWSSKIPQGRLEYLEIVDPETLKPLQTIDGPALAAVAFYLGRARLIDNILLQE